MGVVEGIERVILKGFWRSLRGKGAIFREENRVVDCTLQLLLCIVYIILLVSTHHSSMRNAFGRATFSCMQLGRYAPLSCLKHHPFKILLILSCKTTFLKA